MEARLVRAASFVRGQVYFAMLPGVEGEKPYLVVSNNARNTALGTALVVRITTSDKRHVRRFAGALSPSVMLMVADGLREALALT